MKAHVMGKEVSCKPKDGELALLKLLANCVTFVPGKTEACGSFPLNVFQRLHEHELQYKLTAWMYGDVDIFVTDCNNFQGVVSDFETRLIEHGYTILRRTVKRFQPATGNVAVDLLLSRGEVGTVRTVDYVLEGIKSEISVVNCGKLSSIVEVLNSFDISVCATGCCVDKDLNFFFTYGSKGFTVADDIISGVAHARTDSERASHGDRVEKYFKRGFRKFLPVGEMDPASVVFTNAYIGSLAHPDVSHRKMAASTSPPSGVLLKELPKVGFNVLSLNCSLDLNGSNVQRVTDTIIASDATIVCLQEVTVHMLHLLKERKELTSMYAIYSVMDHEYVVKSFEQATNPKSIYGLCILTRVALVDYWSFPLPSELNRKVDIAFGQGFAIATVHAESSRLVTKTQQVPDTIRMQQFTEIVAWLQEGMRLYGIDFGLLAGDLNTRCGDPCEAVLVESFTDTNTGGATPTMTQDWFNGTTGYRNGLCYLDRVLQLKPAVMVASKWEAQAVEGLSDHKVVSVTLRRIEA
jgi:endonuclease/exonuclease/phosphatase family metal-dependent hydrolase